MKKNMDTATKQKLMDLEVQLVYIFGSYVSKSYGIEPDIDIAVLTAQPSNLDTYDDLYRLFSDYFSDEHKEVDIAFLDTAPLSLKFDVVTSGRLLYEETAGSSLDYKEKIMKEYLDFRFHQNRFEEALLEAIR